MAGRCNDPGAAFPPVGRGALAGVLQGGVFAMAICVAGGSCWHRLFEKSSVVPLPLALHPAKQRRRTGHPIEFWSFQDCSTCARLSLVLQEYFF